MRAWFSPKYNGVYAHFSFTCIVCSSLYTASECLEEPGYESPVALYCLARSYLETNGFQFDAMGLMTCPFCAKVSYTPISHSWYTEAKNYDWSSRDCNTRSYQAQ